MTFSSAYFFDLTTFLHSEIFLLSKYPWDVLSHLSTYLHTLPLGLHKGSISPQAYLIDPHLISIGEGSIIEAGASIQGPCVIGKNCVVRHGAYIRGEVLTGDNCVIGHASEIKQAILLNHTHAAHFNYVGNSILGNHVNLGAGVRCANFKLDHSMIAIQINEQKLPTQMRKLGAIIGDRSQIGCNTVSNPGTLIGQDVRCYPCLNIRGFIPSRSFIKSPQPTYVTTSY